MYECEVTICMYIKYHSFLRETSDDYNLRTDHASSAVTLSAALSWEPTTRVTRKAVR